MHDYTTLDDFTSLRHIQQQVSTSSNDDSQSSARQLEQDVARTIAAISECGTHEDFLSSCVDNLLAYLEREGLRIDSESHISQAEMDELMRELDCESI